MATLVKKFLPRRFKETIKRFDSERRLGASIRQLASMRENDTGLSDLLAELAHGWGEDGYRARGGYLEEVARRARAAQSPVLEIGSGLTTLVLATLAGLRGVPVWTLEHDEEYFRNTEAKLKRFNLTNVHLTLAPLKDYGDFCWYDPTLDALPRNFGLVVADGPPGDVKGGRFGLLPLLRSHFAPGVVILLDDAERTQEKAALRKWMSEYGVSYESHSQNGKAWAICSFPGEQISRPEGTGTM